MLGQGRIIVNILDKNGQKTARVLSEGDGYFTFLGLKPGRYTAEIDKAQLETLGFKAAPGESSFEIKVDEYGDIVDDLEFVLENLQEETSNPAMEDISQGNAQEQVEEQDEEQIQEQIQEQVKELPVPEIPEQKYDIPQIEADPEFGEAVVYRVQVVASNVSLSPNHPSLRNMKDIEMHIYEGMFKYSIGKSTSHSEATKLRNQLRSEGFEGAFVIAFRNGQRVEIPRNP